MKHAFVFPGQGAQFPGMGKVHYENSSFAKKFFEQANEILGFRISDVMFNGSEEDLKQTTSRNLQFFSIPLSHIKQLRMQNPIWLPAILLAKFSALVANGTLSFDKVCNW